MHDISLKYFHAVAKAGSLSAASEELHVAVSAISRQITQLEEKLQLPLFERKARGMSLTTAGDILYTYSLRNALEFKNVLAEMKGINNIQQQSIALACPEGMAWDFLPHAVAQFRHAYPSARFSIQVVGSSKATQLVKEGKVDAALTFSLQPEQGVEVTLQCPSPVVALLSNNHPLAEKAFLNIKDLTEYPLASSEPGTTLSYLLDIACHVEGIQMAPALTSSTVGTIYTFVAESSDAIALCGELTVARRAKHDNLVIRPIHAPSLMQRSLQVQVMSRRKHSIIVRYFLTYLSDLLTQQTQ
ncbi:LysR family transcriptional regulator [Marinomonas spartinae]|uniref:LysR family transcriptional regulator n=1 Tax=Marinomonas spartinae TaxID=1792290 RepID=UPI0018F256A5|nr:LysR family transcriptional regulator [Marinomonas spartinae]MBJ7556502.1 LysR family transcriptional regulator [Marinomonas spartinae]